MARRLPWPRKGDKVFTSADDWWNNARLRLSPDDMVLYADGYKEAADIVTRYVARHRRSQDFLVYPCAFLYRQHIELELKMIIRDGARLLDEKEERSLHHGLGSLWQEARRIIERVWPDGAKKDLDVAGELIAQFEQIDPHGTAFRYAHDRKGNRSIPKDVSHINLRNLSQVVGRLSALLDGVSDGLAAYLEMREEAAMDSRP